MAYTLQILSLLSFSYLLSNAQTLSSCDQVPGNPGNGKETYLTSFACRCSGSDGCDSVQFAGYSNYQYAELVISDQAGRRFEQQPTMKWQRAGVRPTKNDSVQLIATTQFSGFGKASWAGWGAGLSDSAALNLNDLTPAAKKLVLSEYFDSKTGNAYNLVRTNIGTSTYSTHPYTYDEVEGDFDLEHFNLTSEDYDLKMPILSEIAEMTDLELISALWTGPVWLKDVNLDTYGKIIKSDPKYQQALVQYLAKYVDAYQAAGFKFWGISPLNAPTDAGVGSSSGFPNTQWQGYYYGLFLYRYLAPYFQKNYPDIQIISNENNKDATILWMTFLADVQMKLNRTGILDTGLFDNTNFFGVHSVARDHITPGIISRVPEITSVDFHPISTENEYALLAGYTANDFLGSWSMAEAYARNLINDLNINSTLWMDWNMVLNSRGGPSWAGRYAVPTIMADPDDPDVFYKNPSFYVIGHFSKLIKKGWSAIKARVPYSGPHHTLLDVTVMESPDKSERAAIILSRYDDEVEVNYFDRDLKKELPFTIPARSISTLYYVMP